ncbi:MAG TPA: hypothetical protein VMT96_00480 [Candidatus Bathyarchaeia archaeon]|nr:hypothetical protein [Candidatus Bathyarchaeia archaeon]
MAMDRAVEQRPLELTPAQCALANTLLEIGAVQLEAPNVRSRHPQLGITLNLRTPHHPTRPGPLAADVMALIQEEIRLALFGRWGLFDRHATISGPEVPFTDLVETIGRKDSRLTLRHVALPSRFLSGGIIGEYRLADEQLNRKADRVLLVDDYMDGRIFDAANVIINTGLRLYAVLAFIDVGGPDLKRLRRDGHNVLIIMSLQSMLDYYHSEGKYPE